MRALVVAWLVLAGCGGAAAAGSEGDLSQSPPPSGPVVVELFTSQGCSSCPPADRLLSGLATEPAMAGRVVTLAFHVDYWDDLGWRDRFSSPRWSDRQRDYGRVFGLGGVYTPQVVVDGRGECVGSREGDVRREIERALAAPAPGRVTLSLVAVAGGAALRAEVEARLVAPAGGRSVEVLVALVEDGLTTAVESGENARRTLASDRVVRRLERAFVLSADAGAEGAGEVTFTLEPDWKRAGLSAVALLQDSDSRAILGAATASADAP